MWALQREQTAALAVLAALLLAAVAAPVIAFVDRANATQELADQRETLGRLLTRARAQGAQPKARTIGSAPAGAFLAATSAGLAGANLQAYIERLARQHAAIVSIAVQQSSRDDPPDTIRVETSLDLDLDALQTLLYQLESGVPYVFVDALSIRLASNGAPAGSGGLLHVTLALRGLWHKNAA